MGEQFRQSDQEYSFFLKHLDGPRKTDALEF